MTYVKLLPVPGVSTTPGAFLDTQLKDGELWAACCFISREVADRVGTYLDAVDQNGVRVVVQIPEFEGLREGVSVIRGLYEAGVRTKFYYV